MPEPLVVFTEKGLFCPQGDFYIDPWQPVPFAIITHAHSDHARWGMGAYLSHPISIAVMRHRLSGTFKTQGILYGEKVRLNGVVVSLHPAGHIPGSAQVRLEYQGEVWVISGDYKLHNDGISTPFEPVKCHHFVTECTFGLPVFRWPDPKIVHDDITQWWQRNAELGINSVLFAYALGKAQRVLHHLPEGIGKIYVHGAVAKSNEILASEGVPLRLDLMETVGEKKPQSGSLIVAPPSAFGSPWLKKFGRIQTGMASGWMMLRGMKRRRNADRGFVLSDHADWNELISAVQATGAERVYATHGYTDIFARYLNDMGINAEVVQTAFVGESIAPGESSGE